MTCEHPHASWRDCVENVFFCWVSLLSDGHKWIKVFKKNTYTIVIELLKHKCIFWLHRQKEISYSFFDEMQYLLSFQFSHVRFIIICVCTHLRRFHVGKYLLGSGMRNWVKLLGQVSLFWSVVRGRMTMEMFCKKNKYRSDLSPPVQLASCSLYLQNLTLAALLSPESFRRQADWHKLRVKDNRIAHPSRIFQFNSIIAFLFYFSQNPLLLSLAAAICDMIMILQTQVWRLLLVNFG